MDRNHRRYILVIITMLGMFILFTPGCKKDEQLAAPVIQKASKPSYPPNMKLGPDGQPVRHQ